MKKLLLSLTVLLVLWSAAGNVLGATYDIIDLGDFGGRWSEANGINASGQVVGGSCLPWNGFVTPLHAYLWSNGHMTDLGTLGGPSSVALGINASGQVVGGVYLPGSSSPEAFLWSNGQMTDLGVPGFARTINDSGQVVGEGRPSYGAGHAFLWSNGQLTDLGTLGGAGSAAYGINNIGQVVGNSGLADGSGGAFLWSDGQMTDLGLPGVADAINDSGQVVGWWAAVPIPGQQGYYTHALLYSNGQMTDLGTLYGGNSEAHGINASGQVVGYSDGTGGSSWHAFLWSNGQMTDLNTLIDPASAWELGWANGINDSGQIVGLGSHNGQANSAFLMTPIPEPCTFALLGIGVVSLSVCGWWRRWRVG